METRLRMLLVLGGLPRPQAQAQLFSTAGRFVARVDLLDAEPGLAIEYDGEITATGSSTTTGARTARRSSACTFSATPVPTYAIAHRPWSPRCAGRSTHTVPAPANGRLPRRHEVAAPAMSHQLAWDDPALEQQPAPAHDLVTVGPDVGVAGEHVDVARRLPVGPRLGSVRVAEGHVVARELLVLQEVAHDPGEADVGTDRELGGPVGLGVLGEISLDLTHDLGAPGHRHLPHPAVVDPDPDRLLEEAVFGGEVVPHLLPHQDAVQPLRRREDLSLGQVSPLARLPVAPVGGDPAPRGIEGGPEVRPELGLDLDQPGVLDPLERGARHAVDLRVVARHPVEHQLARDPDHVPVPQALLAHQLEERVPERELPRQPFTDVERRRRAERVDRLAQRGGELERRPVDPVLDREALGRRPRGLRLLEDRVGDVLPPAVVDHRDAILGADVEADSHRVAGTGSVLGQHASILVGHEQSRRRHRGSTDEVTAAPGSAPPPPFAARHGRAGRSARVPWT